MERKLASIQEIAEIIPIQGADRICQYRINGWLVVDQVNKYNVGDYVIYCEIDSWLPTELAPFLSRGNEPRIFNGIKGERLRTVKLRKALSQGLLLPLDTLKPYVDYETYINYTIDDDVTQTLNIQKWEKPVPAQLAGQMKGNFPSFIPKTDQERVQNLSTKTKQTITSSNTPYEITEKLDGSSMTIYYNSGTWGVCSRNVDLKLDQEGNTFVDMFNRIITSPRFADNWTNLQFNFAIQGELIGPNIQGNQYNLSQHEFYVFDIFNINTQSYLSSQYRLAICQELGLQHVPIISKSSTITEDYFANILSTAEGTSALNNSEREGLVYKEIDPLKSNLTSFKAISNKWLLSGHED